MIKGFMFSGILFYFLFLFFFFNYYYYLFNNYFIQKRHKYLYALRFCYFVVLYKKKINKLRKYKNIFKKIFKKKQLIRFD